MKLKNTNYFSHLMNLSPLPPFPHLQTGFLQIVLEVLKVLSSEF